MDDINYYLDMLHHLLLWSFWLAALLEHLNRSFRGFLLDCCSIYVFVACSTVLGKYT